MSDVWICLKCNTSNADSSKSCVGCNSGKFWHGIEAICIEHEGKKFFSKKPTITHLDEVRLSNQSNYLLTKCPSCNLLMVYRDVACPHCRHILSGVELKAQEVLNHYRWTYYLKSVALWLVILLLLAYIIA